MEEEKRISEEELKKDVAAAEARIRKTDDFTSPEELYGELIASVKKYHPSDDISHLLPEAFFVVTFTMAPASTFSGRANAPCGLGLT